MALGTKARSRQGLQESRRTLMVRFVQLLPHIHKKACQISPDLRFCEVLTCTSPPVLGGWNKAHTMLKQLKLWCCKSLLVPGIIFFGSGLARFCCLQCMAGQMLHTISLHARTQIIFQAYPILIPLTCQASLLDPGSAPVCLPNQQFQ